jgi:hypothetical protein
MSGEYLLPSGMVRRGGGAAGSGGSGCTRREGGAVGPAGRLGRTTPLAAAPHPLILRPIHTQPQALPLGAMIAKLKRAGMLQDVMAGGEGRARCAGQEGWGAAGAGPPRACLQPRRTVLTRLLTACRRAPSTLPWAPRWVSFKGSLEQDSREIATAQEAIRRRQARAEAALHARGPHARRAAAAAAAAAADAAHGSESGAAVGSDGGLEWEVTALQPAFLGSGGSAGAGAGSGASALTWRQAYGGGAAASGGWGSGGWGSGGWGSGGWGLGCGPGSGWRGSDASTAHPAKRAVVVAGVTLRAPNRGPPAGLRGSGSGGGSRDSSGGLAALPPEAAAAFASAAAASVLAGAVPSYRDSRAVVE